MADVKARILEILQPGQMFLASLATVTEDGKPWVRYVSPKIADDLTLRRLIEQREAEGKTGE